MGKSLGIAAFVILLLSVPIPIAGNYISLLAVLLLAVAALVGEKTWVVITDLVAWVKMFLLSPSWHIMMFSGAYIRGASQDIRAMGTADGTLGGLANQSADMSSGVNHIFLIATVFILALPIAILVLKAMVSPNRTAKASKATTPPDPKPLEDSDRFLLVLVVMGGLATGLLGLRASQAEAKTPARYADMFSYCAAVGTINQSDHRYSGPDYPPALAAALHTTPKALKDGMTAGNWRCVNHRVLVCGGSMYADYCDKADARAPTNDEREFCQQNPNSDNIPYAVTGHQTVFDWSCHGTMAVADKQISPVDDQGYASLAWKILLPSGRLVARGQR